MKKQLIFIGCFVCNVCSLPQTERKFLKLETLPTVNAKFSISIVENNIHNKAYTVFSVPMYFIVTITINPSLIPIGIADYQLLPWNNFSNSFCQYAHKPILYIFDTPLPFFG